MSARIFASDFKETPYWWEAADPGQASPPETPAVPEKTDVAIVGGGYAGLSCALELARRNISCTVFDAEAIGYGASSRNGGMVSGGINLGKGIDLAATFGHDRAKGMLDAVFNIDPPTTDGTAPSTVPTTNPPAPATTNLCGGRGPF